MPLLIPRQQQRDLRGLAPQFGELRSDSGCALFLRSAEITALRSITAATCARLFTAARLAGTFKGASERIRFLHFGNQTRDIHRRTLGIRDLCVAVLVNHLDRKLAVDFLDAGMSPYVRKKQFHRSLGFGQRRRCGRIDKQALNGLGQMPDTLITAGKLTSVLLQKLGLGSLELRIRDLVGFLGRVDAGQFFQLGQSLASLVWVKVLELDRKSVV